MINKGKISVVLLIVVYFGVIFYFLGKDDKQETKSYENINQNKHDEQLKMAKKIQENRQKENSEYFKNNKGIILKKLQSLLNNKEYSSVLKETKKYTHIDDNELMQIHNKAKELKLYNKVLKISADDLDENKRLYALLLGINPKNSLYKNKLQYYKEKIVKRENENTLFGKIPIRSSWDGSYFEVELYLKSVMHDPDSLKMDGCTKVFRTDEGWLVGCNYRGKNLFGAYTREANWFIIRQGQVVKMYDSNKFKW